MSTEITDAQRQFNENLQLFASPIQAPEKHNLYAGLLNLSRAIAGIERQLDQLERNRQ